jgi:hypothetical protein
MFSMLFPAAAYGVDPHLHRPAQGRFDKEIICLFDSHPACRANAPVLRKASQQLRCFRNSRTDPCGQKWVAIQPASTP